MFSYIKGLLTEVMEDRIVVETGGVGWNIYVPLSVLDRLPGIGQELKVYTSFQVREDAMTLYGFLSRQDQEMFRLLLGVNGVGPKAAAVPPAHLGIRGGTQGGFGHFVCDEAG